MNRQERLIYELVLERDRVMYWEMNHFENPVWDVSLEAWLMTDPWVCAAPVIDLSQLGRCSGEMERDHVHEHAGGTKGKRAPTTMETLVILCHHHHQDGWATAHRPEIRTYIKEANERYRDVSDPG